MQRNRTPFFNPKFAPPDPWMAFLLEEDDPDDEDIFYGVPTILWTGALRIAGGESIAPMPEGLSALAEQYFTVFAPDVKA